MHDPYRRLLLILALAGLAPVATADWDQDCVQQALEQAPEAETLAQLRARCRSPEAVRRQLEALDTGAAPPPPDSVLEQRLAYERATRNTPAVISIHKRNYLLPLTYANHPNQAGQAEGEAPLDHLEAKFQFSVKLPVWQGLLQPRDSLYFGFTTQSWWQLYNRDWSAPFRETNYEPELFYQFEQDWSLLGLKGKVIQLGFSHQSNGRSQPLSRSWNRLYAQFLFENGHWVYSFKHWYRLREDPKDSPEDASGDDNPDIERYLGHFELGATRIIGRHDLGFRWRNNLRQDNRGAIQIDWSFPLGGRFRGYAQYFNGYGESLIDYDQSLSRIGVGILLSDLF